ncbi:MAG: hypothetical protein ACRDP6_36400 [Actinoallomurus sp.]
MDPLKVLAALLVIAGLYYLSIRLHPYTSCGRCRRRRGKNAGSTRRVWGNCGACRGTGQKERLGVRLFFRRR